MRGKQLRDVTDVRRFDNLLAEDRAVGQVTSAQVNFMTVVVNELERSMSLQEEGFRAGIKLLCVRRWDTSDPPVANVDLLLVLDRPRLDPVIMNRFLVKGESTGIPLAVVLSKADLVTQEMKDSWEKQLMESGYKPYICSVETVGKSSLINFLRGKSCLPPDDIQALDEVDDEVIRVSFQLSQFVNGDKELISIAFPPGSRPGYNSRRLKISTKEEPCLISSADKSVQEMDRLFDEIDCKSYPRVACGSLASHEQQSSSNINLTTLLNLRCLDRAMSLHSRRGGRRAFAWLGRADDLEAQA
ncbi:hypothetical protein SELMODRAFT_444481 [Selaginella moellendorffii]|uniref:EngC GTPase domain-containing protein n=1 Tax=Selaginella moellendorffii TaxID=88036 RepID=D8SA05_SELML|nr:hypothetical protein SELMODRAFT_444481 [Selaginella moellendorffii]